MKMDPKNQSMGTRFKSSRVVNVQKALSKNGWYTNGKRGNDEDCGKWKDKIDFNCRKQKRRCEIPFMDSLNIWIDPKQNLIIYKSLE